MWSDGQQYRNLQQKDSYIDKTNILEKEILGFPSIYIEGAAVSGKTTLVRMYLQKHPEIEVGVLWLDEVLDDWTVLHQQLPIFREELYNKSVEETGNESAKEFAVEHAVEHAEGIRWIVLENVPVELDVQVAKEIGRLIRHLPEKDKVILVGRERIPREVLQLMWNREMGYISQKDFCLTLEEIQELIEQRGSRLDAKQLYEITGGWAGCVDMMLRLEVDDPRESYEIRTYLQEQIWETLSAEEMQLMHCGNVCPWLNVEICEKIWGIQNADEWLERLERKGLMKRLSKEACWQVAPLFLNQIHEQKKPQFLNQIHEQKTSQFSNQTYPQIISPFLNRNEEQVQLQRNLAEWYGQHGFIKEMLICAKTIDDDKYWHQLLKEYAVTIPFAGVDYAEVLQWEEKSPEAYFLRGMYCYFHQDLDGMKRELGQLKERIESDFATKFNGEYEFKVWEMYLNLAFLSPFVSVDEWLELLSETGNDTHKICLHVLTWEKMSCLCGLRDVTSLFACSKKEENRKERIWKECMGEEEWMFYRFARIEYYLETERKDSIPKEDWDLLRYPQKLPEKFWINVLYLLERFPTAIENNVQEEAVCWLQNRMIDEEEVSDLASAEWIKRRKQNAQAIGCAYLAKGNGQERLINWMHYVETRKDTSVTEENLTILYCQAKGYLFLNQYEKAEKLLLHLQTYLQTYHRNYFLAEITFALAITEWHLDCHGQALRYAIESFVINGNSRYVECYAEYGKKGTEVLEAYIEWMQKNAPEGWHRKKKYNYGNVLRMPEADYLAVVLRRSKKEARQSVDAPKNFGGGWSV